MPSERIGYAPWSLTREAGVLSATVNGEIKVPQNVQPTIDTGFCDEKGNWIGIRSSETEFTGFTKHVEVPNTGRVLVPDNAEINSIDMTGYSDIFIAIRPSNGGAVEIEARMGPDTNSFANLKPVVAAATLRGCFNGIGSEADVEPLFSDGVESLTADAWNIIIIEGRLKNQKNLIFSIDNDSGDVSTIDFAFMRMV